MLELLSIAIFPFLLRCSWMLSVCFRAEGKLRPAPYRRSRQPSTSQPPSSSQAPTNLTPAPPTLLSSAFVFASQQSELDFSDEEDADFNDGRDTEAGGGADDDDSDEERESEVNEILDVDDDAPKQRSSFSITGMQLTSPKGSCNM